ncbi:MAG: endonuclease MutS2, partial [Clostridia bacterium]|nr:endonuclease MutS2 [Clostridia bacterium]
MNQTLSELDRKALVTLEYNKVIEKLKEQAACDGSRELAEQLLPASHPDEIKERLALTEQARLLIGRKGSPPIHGIRDVTEALQRAVKMAALSPRELLRVAALLRTVRGLKQYIEQDTEDTPALREMFSLLTPQKTLEDRISTAILSEEEISDRASPELAAIRRKIASASSRIKETLQNMIRSPSYQKYLQEPIVTLRGDRYVVPVKTEHRADVPGLVHDVSGSGATCFVEPMAVVEANNELKVLKVKEQDEIERILLELSSFVAAQEKEIALNYDLVVGIDFAFAKARLAWTMEATLPYVAEHGPIELRRARHPLIERDKVVPIDLVFKKGVDTVIVTGPNTGGKTVTLKTLGLMHLMAAAGLHIPAAEGSQVAVFSHILSDIGDEQSIEQSLSTFSSHMVNIVKILETADDKSLVLLDELGAGTDPVEGAALATAILERLREKGAHIAATTHYPELKTYALNTAGVVNASCEFDVETLRPTYRLLLGMPGKSNAYAISLRLGMDPAIVDRARELTSAESTAFEDVLAQFDARRQELEKELEAVRKESERLNLERATLELEKEHFRNRRERELEQASQESRRQVAMAREMYNRTIAELEALKKQKDAADFGERLYEARQKIRRDLRKASSELDPVRERETEA